MEFVTTLCSMGMSTNGLMLGQVGCPDITTNFITQVVRSVCVTSVRTPKHLLYLPLYSPQRQIPFLLSYSLRRGHTSILQVHHLISQLRERKREVEFGTTLCSMGMIMNGLMLLLVQKVLVGMANINNTQNAMM